MLSRTQTLEGVTSLLPNGKHIPLFDIEGKNCSLERAKSGLSKLQDCYGLPDIFLTSDKQGSYRAWCFAEADFVDYLRMQLDLIDAGVLDYNFFYWTVFQGKSTLRTSSKKNRPPQEVVSVLQSYSVPIPESVEKVVYDTGIQKRGISILLGENGKIILGDN